MTTTPTTMTLTVRENNQKSAIATTTNNTIQQQQQQQPTTTTTARQQHNNKIERERESSSNSIVLDVIMLRDDVGSALHPNGALSNRCRARSLQSIELFSIKTCVVNYRLEGVLLRWALRFAFCVPLLGGVHIILGAPLVASSEISCVLWAILISCNWSLQQSVSKWPWTRPMQFSSLDNKALGSHMRYGLKQRKSGPIGDATNYYGVEVEWTASTSFSNNEPDDMYSYKWVWCCARWKEQVFTNILGADYGHFLSDRLLRPTMVWSCSRRRNKPQCGLERFVGVFGASRTDGSSNEDAMECHSIMPMSVGCCHLRFSRSLICESCKPTRPKNTGHRTNVSKDTFQ